MLVTLVVAEIRAQGGPAPVTSVVSAKIGAVTEISGSGTKDDAVFEFTTAAELTGGLIKPNVFTLTAKSNKPYYVQISTEEPNFSGGSAEAPLSVDKLSVSIDGESYVTLSTTPKKLIGVEANASRGSADYQIYYQMIPGFTAAPAEDYVTTVIYTISAP